MIDMRHFAAYLSKYISNLNFKKVVFKEISQVKPAPHIFLHLESFFRVQKVNRHMKKFLKIVGDIRKMSQLLQLGHISV